MSSASVSSGVNVWKGELRLNLHSHPGRETNYIIKVDDFYDNIDGVIDADEDILEIILYTHPLYVIQLTQEFLNHAFVVLRTEKWWWIIEKYDEAISIQRGEKDICTKKKEDLRSRGLDRLVTVKKDDGKLKILDLMNKLYEELKIGYGPLSQCFNCQGFAKRIFNDFAKTKTTGGYNY